MPYKDLVKCWHEGVLAAENKDFDSALKNFTCIEDPPSKICFNIGCIHLLRGDLQQALEAYDQSVHKDHCLAVGYFQRSYVQFRLQRYEKGLSDCHLALANLRNNSIIDYKQLGLRHLLYTWEVLYNTAALLSYLGKWHSAEEKLREAMKWLPGDTRNAKMDDAMDQVQKHLVLEPLHLPQGEFFRPRKQEVEQLQHRDFLGKPKVISSVVPNDQYSGFEPLRPQKPGYYEPSREAMQGHEPGYHRVLTHYYPDNSRDVAVKASTVLYVLNKDGDWATAIHDGQKILIPTNFLEPTDPPKADIKKLNTGIPLPPMKMPPTRPNVKPELPTWLQQGNSVPVLDGLPPRPAGDPPLPVLVGLPPRPKRDVPVPVVAGLPPLPERDVPVPVLAGLPIEPAWDPPLLTKMKAPPLVVEPAVEIAVPLHSSSVTTLDPGKAKPDPVYEVAIPPGEEEDKIVLQVHMEFTVSMTVSKNITYPEFQDLLRHKLRQKGEQMDIDLSYRNSDGKQLTPVKCDQELREMWYQAKDKKMMICCKDAGHCVGRPILCHMTALYDYPAQGPEDLTFIQGDVIDVLSEVNEEWLEGHCNGNIGIFPKCFASESDDNQKTPGT
ncbi:NADPH oxidase activator 1 [Rhinophrynus dorsalis]